DYYCQVYDGSAVLF
nr:immunoglobulin light chain junction region [Macaca mulatta]MOW01182.1 immunoglobulin light chain junction region [Macaca mulatta]MOW01213.1 immunoglobulin light chain junction region [Macaca mulatta]MOW60795.1 immunoglobulin light chain junction region [Macaca mulatta]MOW61079.1 immunoglobulin light chain junction region [Macaca mulatta]